MNKSKTEQYSEDNKVTIEIVVENGKSKVSIYKDKDTCIQFFHDKFLNNAIEKAVNNHQENFTN